MPAAATAPMSRRLPTAAIDQHVAGRVRQARKVLGITQRELGAAIGVSYRQVHKYERGLNRVDAGTLFSIANALKLPVSYFYQGLGCAGPPPGHNPIMAKTVASFSAIRDRRRREAFALLVRALASD